MEKINRTILAFEIIGILAFGVPFSVVGLVKSDLILLAIGLIIISINVFPLVGIIGRKVE